MHRLRRRRLLSLAGTALGTALAGCGGDVETEFVVSRAQIVHQNRRGMQHPEDVGVRASVENTTPTRQEGTVVVSLERTDGGEVLESWTERRDVSVSRGTSVRVFFVFESVFEPGDEIDGFRARANIE